MLRFSRLNHIIGLVLFGLAALGLPGCSAVKLGYSNAPEISHWWLDSYLDFSSAQSTKVRADLATFQTWHRHYELPNYVKALEKLQAMAPGNVTPEQVCDFYTDLKPRFQAMVDHSEPLIAAIAPSLKPEQLAHLARQLDKRSDKWREEWLDGSLLERQDRRFKQLLDRAEMIYGRLEPAQLAILRAKVATSSFDATISYRESLRRHQDTLQTFKRIQGEPANLPQIEEQIHALLARSMDSPDASYKIHMDKMAQENCKAFADLHNGSTPAQRRKAIATLKEYEADARALMRKR